MAETSKSKSNPWLIALAVMIATFMEVMDTSIASVAVPYIAGSTASTADEAEWVLTVYLVSNAVFLMASNWFAQKFGRKRYLMFSVVVFTVASFACGIAPTLGFILFARVIQGAGGAHCSRCLKRSCSKALVGNSSITRQLTPPDRLNRKTTGKGHPS
jgi:MFS family permease